MNTQSISYLTDEKGEKTGVFIPIKMLRDPEYIEDLHDIIISKFRLDNDEFIPFE